MPKKPPQKKKIEPFEGGRIAKVMARAGLCSRREAEAWIAAGRVELNGKVLDSPALNVTEKDVIKVDGAPLPTMEQTRLWIFNKPTGCVTSRKDPEGRPTVFDHMPSDLPHVMTVGRLDMNSEGLLLLTNDGGLSRDLELPSSRWTRRYRVRVHGRIDDTALAKLKALEKGITVEGVKYGSILVQFDGQRGSNAWLTVSLKEGKNREIRRVLEHLGFPVNRLIRISYGPFQLGELAKGEVKEIPRRFFMDQLKPKQEKS